MMVFSHALKIICSTQKMAEDFESHQEIIGIITLDSPLKGIEDTVTHLSKLILYSGAAAILISGFIAFSLSQKIAGPLRAMNRSAREIAKGNFKSRIAGIGISKEEQEKIWERFYKVDKARGNAKKSSGLGLAITRQLVELQGGITEVESSPGQGSIFNVSMPTQPTK